MIVTTQYLNEKQVAELTGISLGKLRMDRHKSQGIPYHKLGRSVRYNMEDITDYFNMNRVSPEGGVN